MSVTSGSRNMTSFSRSCQGPIRAILNFRIETALISGRVTSYDTLWYRWWPMCNTFANAGDRWHLCRPRDVIKGHESVTGNNSRTERDTASCMVSLCLYRQDASGDMQHDLFHESSCDLDLRSIIQLDLPRSKYTCSDVSWRVKHDGANIHPLSFLIQKLFAKNCRGPKSPSFLVWRDLERSRYDLKGSNWVPFNVERPKELFGRCPEALT